MCINVYCVYMYIGCSPNDNIKKKTLTAIPLIPLNCTDDNFKSNALARETKQK